jgi:hypothetical protein|nr:hypothetical protein [Actinomycetales bacterium]
MPLSSAIIAAALAAAPGTPADPGPAAAPGVLTPGKQIAAVALQHPDNPDLIANRTLEILGKPVKAGPLMDLEDLAEASGPQRPAAEEAQTGAEAGPAENTAVQEGNPNPGSGSGQAPEIANVSFPEFPEMSFPLLEDFDIPVWNTGDRNVRKQPINVRGVPGFTVPAGQGATGPVVTRNRPDGGQDFLFGSQGNQPVNAKLSGEDLAKQAVGQQFTDADQQTSESQPEE